jgi:hypothetical protein
VPAVPSCVLDPLREALLALLPPHLDAHPLGFHRRRIVDAVVFDKLVEVLSTGSATSGSPMPPVRPRRCAGAATSGSGYGVWEQLRLAARDAYEKLIGPDLADLAPI